jgi:hypothetical protein
MDQNSQRFALWNQQKKYFPFFEKENVFLEKKKEHSTK